MRVKATVSMVMNLDKCIGCHTCSVVCKNTWTSRKGMEYAWFNNVETKPGTGYPSHWEDQERYDGGWVKEGDQIVTKQGGKLKSLLKIFGNPKAPTFEDYYEPFSLDYEHLQTASLSRTMPTARMHSLLTGKKMEKPVSGANWEDDLGGAFKDRSKDVNLTDLDKEIISKFENTFMIHLPRMCNHCLNPVCVAACPSGAAYKRDNDGIVLIDQDKCRGWRQCVSACPYKKTYFNHQSAKSEKCTFCYPRVENGEAPACAHSCVGRIRYVGVLLYDVDKIGELAKADKMELVAKEAILNPFDPEVIKSAEEQNVPESWVEHAQRSPVYKLVVEEGLAYGLHPEYRTLPMVWYIPPLSPFTQSNDGHGLVNVENLRIPMEYLANLMTNKNTSLILTTLQKLEALRNYMRRKHVEKVEDEDILLAVGLNKERAESLYRLLALAKYDDRFVIPKSKEETVELNSSQPFMAYNIFNMEK